MRILAFTKYDEVGPSSRLRFYQFKDTIEKSGHQLDFQPLFTSKYLEKKFDGKWTLPHVVMGFLIRLWAFSKLRNYDVIWVEYELFPYVPAVFERFLKRSRKTVIFDFDDAIHHKYDKSTNSLVKAVLGKKIETVIKLADIVNVGSDYLYKFAESHGAKQINFTPTVVKRVPTPPKRTFENELLRIGWIGTPYTQRYLQLFANAINGTPLARTFTLEVMGATEQCLDYFDGVDITLHPWSVTAERQFLSNIDIGIMPLVDGDWERGKCGFKLIQYMSLGAPFIASAVGENIAIRDRSGAGLLVSDQDAWRDALKRFCADRALLREMSEKGLNSVENFYSVEVQQDQVMSMLEGVSASRHLG